MTSILEYKTHIELGDTVILYEGPQSMKPIVVTQEGVHNMRYGTFKFADMIGKPYGSKMYAGRGWLVLLFPTPELWTLALPHRTQILYNVDISLVALHLDLVPGCVVVESGTGSGSLSHSLIRSIAPTGFLHTFEYHEQRATAAREEFASHGLKDHVKVYHRNVCADGFDLDAIADAVFLDLPRPWEALDSAIRALKPRTGRLCSFSPCIEQVQRMCEALRKTNHVDIKTYQCLARNFEMRHTDLPEINFDFQKQLDACSIASGEQVVLERYHAHTPLVTRPYPEMPGHTGYLTFARVSPFVPTDS